MICFIIMINELWIMIFDYYFNTTLTCRFKFFLNKWNLTCKIFNLNEVNWQSQSLIHTCIFFYTLVLYIGANGVGWGAFFKLNQDMAPTSSHSTLVGGRKKVVGSRLGAFFYLNRFDTYLLGKALFDARTPCHGAS